MGPFMKNRQTGNHHKVVEGLWRHYDDTCTVHDADTYPVERDFFCQLDPPETNGPIVDCPAAEEFHAKRETALTPYRLAPSRKGGLRSAMKRTA